MTLSKAELLSRGVSSRKLNLETNIQQERGWSPVLKPVYDDTRVLLQVIGWVGGEGNEPFDPSLSTYYLGTDDFVTNTIDAIDIASGYMSSTFLNDIIDADEVSLTLGTDGYLNLAYSTFYNHHTGSPAEEHVEQTYLFSNDPTLSPGSQAFGATQYAIRQAIDTAKAIMKVPIISYLNASVIAQIEALPGLTTDNPYFALVDVDNRTSGASGSCTTIGYEEMCSIPALDGGTCTAEIPEVLATWLVTITGAGAGGDTIELALGSTTIAQYTVITGDAVGDIASALASYAGNHTAFTITGLSGDHFTLVAPVGSGSTWNAEAETVNVTGAVTGTMVQQITGVDYKARTCKGVRGHYIAYDGTNWYDFGLSFSNTVNTPYYENKGTLHTIVAGYDLVTEENTDYIVSHLVVSGTFTLGTNSNLIII